METRRSTFGNDLAPIVSSAFKLRVQRELEAAAQEIDQFLNPQAVPEHDTRKTCGINHPPVGRYPERPRFSPSIFDRQKFKQRQYKKRHRIKLQRRAAASRVYLALDDAKLDLDLVRMLAIGLTHTQIAKNVGYKDVKHRIRNVRNKHGAVNNAHLVALFFRKGWLT